MFKIGDFSRLAQVSVKTLRYYGQLGLLQPRWIDRFTGYRYYALDQLPRLNRILALKDLGFSLEQIQQMLAEELPPAELRGMVRARHAELERQIQREQARLARIEARLRQIEREGCLPPYDVLLKPVPPQPVVGIRRVLPRYTGMRTLFEELARSLDGPPPFPGLAIYYDGEFRESEVDVEAALPLARPGAATRLVRGLQVHTLPGCETMACAVHQGSYEDLGAAYEALLGWVEQNGYQVDGPNRDLFYQGPEQEPDPAGYVTEVQFPVRRKRIFGMTEMELKDMEPKFVTKKAFNVVGLLYHGCNENNEIPQLWGKLMEHGADLQAAGRTLDAIGVCAQPDPDGSFDYVAGFEMAGEYTVPAGMVAWQIPEHTYAVFTTTLPKLHETLEYIHNTWVPASGYKMPDFYEFELYDDQFDPANPESEFTYYVPVIKK